MNGLLCIGIDPGLSGALVAILTERAQGSGKIVSSERTPVIRPKKGKPFYNERACFQIVSDLCCAYAGNDIVLAIEDITARPSIFIDGVPAARTAPSEFRLGYGYGLWSGILSGFDAPLYRIRPQAWQAIELKGLPRGDATKESAVRRCLDLYPKLDLSKKAEWGKADAALIAHFALKMYRGTEAKNAPL